MAKSLEIMFPLTFSGDDFFDTVLPKVLAALAAKPSYVVFNMHNTQFTEPSALVNMAASASLIKRTLGTIVRLILPSEEFQPVLKYLSYSGFLDGCDIPGQELFYTNKPPFLWNAGQHTFVKGYTLLPFYPITRVSTVGRVFERMEKVRLILQREDMGLPDDIADALSQAIAELASNVLKHNSAETAVGFCMAQRMPRSGTAVCAISDIGIGIRRRMLEQAEFAHLHSVLGKPGGQYSQSLLNSNYRAILEAVNYRKTSSIYGLFNIRKDVCGLMGTLRVHCENASVTYSSRACASCKTHQCENCNGASARVLDRVFPGVHVEIEIPTQSRGRQ